MAEAQAVEGLDPSEIRLIDTGEQCVARIKKVDTVDDWHQVGEAACAIRNAAMRLAGLSGNNVEKKKPAGSKYNAAWAQLAEHAPNIRGLYPHARSAAMWMADHWPEVVVWRETLNENDRMALQHPTSIHRRFKYDHREVADPSAAPKPKANGQGTETSAIEHLIAGLAGLDAEQVADVILERKLSRDVMRLVMRIIRSIRRPDESPWHEGSETPEETEQTITRLFAPALLLTHGDGERAKDADGDPLYSDAEWQDFHASEKAAALEAEKAEAKVPVYDGTQQFDRLRKAREAKAAKAAERKVAKASVAEHRVSHHAATNLYYVQTSDPRTGKWTKAKGTIAYKNQHDAEKGLARFLKGAAA